MKTKHNKCPYWTIWNLALVASLGLSLAANAAEPETIKIGSTVHLQNQFGSDTVNVGSSSSIGKTYLDTRGRVMDKPQFKGVDENVFVSTFGTPDRDKGSGSWKIISAQPGVKDGTPLKYGDEIQLLNGYPGAGYLDVWKEKLHHVFDATNFANPDKTDYSVFTSKNPKGDSSTWIVTAADGKATGEVKDNQVLMLESKSQRNHYLETHGVVTGANGPFKEYKDSVLLVFVADPTGFEMNSEKWQIMLKDGGAKTDAGGSASSGGTPGGDVASAEAKKVLNNDVFEMNAFSVLGQGEGGGYYLAAEKNNGGNLWIAKTDDPDPKSGNKPGTVRLKIKTESLGNDTYGFRVQNAPGMPDNSYLTVKDKLVTVTSQTSGQLAPAAQWVRVDAFAKGSTGSAFSSFQSKKEPTQYLRHGGYRVMIAPAKPDKTTREDESWELEPVKQ